MESAITKIICANNGSMNLDELTANFSSLNLNTKKDRFCVAVLDGEKTVIAKTSVRVCKDRACGGCRNLHLCKRYLLGDCKFGARCCFGHDHTTGPNASVLEQHGLELLDKDELCTLLLQNDNSILPPVCRDFNNGRCSEEDSCWRLHVCERYLRGGCTCARGHDLHQAQPMSALRARGIPSHLICRVKSVYLNAEALRTQERPGRAGGRQQQTSSDSATPGASKGPASNSRGIAEICLYFIKGSCIHGDRCFKAHDALPYRWETKDGQQWSALPSNEDIEKDFCNPDKTYSRGVEPVCFDTMTCGPRSVRRLSTASSVLHPSFVLTTQWLWFWEDQHGNWTQYASAGLHSAATVTSEQLELRFQSEDREDLEFSAGSQAYVLSLQDMIQTNKNYGTKRLVRRRPQFVSSAEVQTIRTSKRIPSSVQSNAKALPGHWDKAQAPETGFKRLALPASSAEYQEVQRLFCSTLTGLDILSIQRIQNPELWGFFQMNRDVMKKKNGGQSVVEKKLFHGTDSKHIDTICLHNFDWRICGTHGTLYGKGSYFARDAKYSHSYTGQAPVRSMFVCRVLVGDYTRGAPGFLRPPSKDGGDTVFYDTCVDSESDPSIFVVFDRPQVYPEYLVTYSDQPRVHSTPPAQAPVPAPAQRPVPAPRPTPAPAPRPTPAPANRLMSSQHPDVQMARMLYQQYNNPAASTSYRARSPPPPPKKNDSCAIC